VNFQTTQSLLKTKLLTPDIYRTLIRDSRITLWAS